MKWSIGQTFFSNKNLNFFLIYKLLTHTTLSLSFILRNFSNFSLLCMGQMISTYTISIHIQYTYGSDQSNNQRSIKKSFNQRIDHKHGDPLPVSPGMHNLSTKLFLLCFFLLFCFSQKNLNFSIRHFLLFWKKLQPRLIPL